MFAGKIFKTAQMQYVCRASGSGSASSNMYPIQIGHGATLASYYTPDYLDLVLGLGMAVSSSHWVVLGATQPTENPTSSASLTFPPLGIDTSVTRSVFTDDTVAEFNLYDIALYMNHDANWELHIGSIDWIFNGETVGSWGGTVLYSSMTPTPMAVPCFPGMMDISVLNSSGTGDATGIPLPMDTSMTWDVTGHLGFRYKLPDGTWYSPPVAWTSPFVPASDPHSPTFPSLTAATMYDGVITVHAVYEERLPFRGTVGGGDLYDNYRRFVNNGGSATLIPNPDKGVVRLNDDYAALVFRGGFPQVKAKGSYLDFSSHSTVSEEREIYAAQSQFLGMVTNASHVIEDPLNVDTYSPVSLSSRSGIVNVEAAYIVPHGTTEWPLTSGLPTYSGATTVEQWDEQSNYVFPSSYGSMSSVLSYLNHFEPLVAYLNTWANPLWSYLLFMPLETANLWKVQGTYATPQEYWLNARMQYLDHPSLPSGERLKKLNDIVTEPLWQNGLAGLIRDQVYGQITSWWGIARPLVDHTQPIADATMNSTSAIAFVDCTGSLVTDIVVDAGSGSAIVEIALGRHDAWPYMFPLLATSVVLGGGANVASIAYTFVDAAGKAVPITPTGIGAATYDIPRSASKKYAGTWGEDKGVGYTPDQGTDLFAASGRSAAYMADADRAAFFALAPLGQYVKLRITVTRTDDTQPCHILYPKWIRPPEYASNFKAHTEVAMVADVVEANGPGFRFGPQSYFDYPIETVLTSPEAAPISGMATALDWLCFRRNVFEAKLATDGLATEIGALWDSDIEWTQVKHLACDPFDCATVTHSFVAQTTSEGPKGVMVNSYSQVPPLAGYPNPTLDGNLRASGVGNKAYSLIATRRHVLTPGADSADDPKLIAPDSSDWLTAGTTLDGWRIGYHTHTVDMSEAVNFLVRKGPKDYAKVHPWHGYFWAGDTSRSMGPALTHDKSGRIYLAAYADEELSFGKAMPVAPTDFEPLNPAGIASTAVDLATGADLSAPLWVVTISSSGMAELRSTYDLGATWKTVISISSSQDVAICRAPGGTLFVFTLESGDIKGRSYDPLGAAIDGPWSTGLSGVSDDARIDATAYPTDGAKYGIDLAIQDGDSSTVYSSTDGGRSFA